MRDNTRVCSEAVGVSLDVAVSVMCFTGCCIAEKGNIDLIRERAAVSQCA